jgi:hypothetical protein
LSRDEQGAHAEPVGGVRFDRVYRRVQGVARVDYGVPGEIRPFRGFWRHGTPLVRPLPIPPFTPRRIRRRSAGVVV